MKELKLVIDRAVKGLPWCGDLALQKVVYLLESVYGLNLGYEFGYHHMGPYSFDLANDLSLGVERGDWTRQSKPIANGRYWVNQYHVQGEPSPQTADTMKVEEALSRMLAEFNSQSDQTDGRRFELVATIHYLRDVQEVPENELCQVLRALKPKFSAADFEDGKKQLALLEQSAADLVKA